MKECQEQPVIFRCGNDDLVGIVHRPVASDAATGVLIVVGGPQYRVGSHRQFTLMARQLAVSGIPVFRFDCRGMGDSDGEVQTFDTIQDDIVAATDAFLETLPSLRKVVLWGLCDAASAVLMFAHADPRIAGLILANPWVRSESGEARAYLKHYYGQRIFQRSFWDKLSSGRVNVIRSAFEYSRTMFRARKGRSRSSSDVGDPFVVRMLRGLGSFRGPVLILISEMDLTAREFTDLCTNSEAWRRVMSSIGPVIIELKSADHTFSSRGALDSAGHHCRNWLESRVPARA